MMMYEPYVTLEKDLENALLLENLMISNTLASLR